ncbi:MAG: hypothetical protein OXF45_01165 [Candidatus Dadabacteria bacterium]|nr:hypothetical protein [Candidatus Dadabacteria bacterium]
MIGAISGLMSLIRGFLNVVGWSTQGWGFWDYLSRDPSSELTFELLFGFLYPIPIAVIPYCLASSFDKVFRVEKRNIPQGWWFATTLRGKIIETAVWLIILLIILSWLF